MVYVLAPLGIIVKLLPEQIEPLFTATVGKAFTALTCVVAVCIHPLLLMVKL